MLVQLAPSIPQSRLLSPPSNCFASPRLRLPPPGPLLRKLSPLSHDDQLLGVGLRTPPADDMSTTYQQAPPVYDKNSSLCTSLAVHPHWPGFAMKKSTSLTRKTSDSRSSAQQHHRYPSQQHQLSQPLGTQSRSSTSSSQVVFIASDPSTKPTTPGTDASSSSSTIKPAESLVFHSLRIPQCISPNGGHLADFAAQMTCLFWFESIDELKKAGSGEHSLENVSFPQLPSLAKPHDQFRKWVCNVLSTTQVTQNVILLALLFIYRLKMSTPQIKGRAGSEYRLLTVALMLGNKFLDDNTYTNKTWAEVSSFAVQEIHVMEVEFLSNMRYNLLASKDEWEEWLEKLACFHRYYERASKVPSSPIRISSPSVQSYTSPITSPTASSLPLSDLPPLTPSSAICFSPSKSRFRAWAAHNRPESPHLPKPTLGFPTSRKRSPESDILEHPAKRQMPYQVGRDHHSVAGGPATVADSTRLPVPHLTIVTNQESAHAASYLATSAYAAAAPPPNNAAPTNVFSLPPLQPCMRTAPVYQTTPPVVTQPAVTPTATMGISANGYVSTGASASTALPNYPPLSYSTPSKHRSPGSLAAFASSPMAEPPLFAPNSGVHTPIAHTPISQSPSVYLQERPSPYKPIRHVNRLLYPPPSASLDQYHLTVPAQQAQMHYQPLGRRNDLRSGVVPEYVEFNRGQRRHVHTPGGPRGPFAP